MVYFEALDLPDESHEYSLQHGCDRIMVLEGSEMQYVQLAARARTAYRQATGLDPFSGDEHLAGMPETSNRIGTSPEWVDSNYELLMDFADVSYLNGGIEDEDGLAKARQQAAVLAGELIVATRVFHEAQRTDFDALFL